MLAGYAGESPFRHLRTSRRESTITTAVSPPINAVVRSLLVAVRPLILFRVMVEFPKTPTGMFKNAGSETIGASP
jgi:hypothetical protein